VLRLTGQQLELVNQKETKELEKAKEAPPVKFT